MLTAGVDISSPASRQRGRLDLCADGLRTGGHDDEEADQREPQPSVRLQNSRPPSTIIR